MNRGQGALVKGQDVRKGWLANLDSLYEMSVDHIDYAAVDKIAFS
jgi:hypothetical protein